MSLGKLHRREFLRLCLLAAGSAGLAACEPTTLAITPTPIAEPSSTPTVRQSAHIKLNEGGDAWTWNKVVRGHLNDAANCKSLLINANGADVEVALSGVIDSKGNSTFSASIPLIEGDNRVVAICRCVDGQEEKSDMNSIQERLRRTPTAAIKIIVDGEQIVFDSSASQMAEGDTSILIDYVWSTRPGNPSPLVMHGIGNMQDREISGEVSEQTISVSTPTTDGEYYVRLRVKDQAGREDTSSSYFVVENGQARVPDYDHENPAWVENAVVYGVIPFKFGDPAFKAITNRLDYLADLGVTALWLAPINVSPSDDYGYAVKDYFELNGAYGTKVEFHRMVQEAHARGIRILMDFVPNHSSDQHPYFVDTKQGPDSSYWDFYARDESGNPTHYFTWTNLLNLNYDNPEVQRMMTEAFSYWVREFDVDGFRVDAAWGVKERRPDFWPLWRKALKRIKPDLLLLAEASARDPYYFDNGFDAAYDWTDQLGHWAWQVVWDTYKLRLLNYNLTNALTNGRDGFHPDALIFRFLNNNDTGERFITRHGEGITRVATALLLTLPGVPCIYTGDELGEEFKPYEDSGPLSWVERVPGLRDYHKQLIALRSALPSLHSRQWTHLTLEAVRDQVAYGYLRYHDENQDPILVLLNFGEESTELVFSLP